MDLEESGLQESRGRGANRQSDVTSGRDALSLGQP